MKVKSQHDFFLTLFGFKSEEKSKLEKKKGSKK